MVKTWSSEATGDIECSSCRSVYEVAIRRFPLKDNDSFSCQVCGAVLRKWNDTRVPEFKLKKAGVKPEQ